MAATLVVTAQKKQKKKKKKKKLPYFYEHDLAPVHHCPSTGVKTKPERKRLLKELVGIFVKMMP
jgi:hypothetical protein